MELESQAEFTFVSIGLNASPQIAPCIICQAPTQTTALTVGSRYADGRQAFACNVHTHNKVKWLLFWAKFKAQQGKVASAAVPSRYYECRPACTATEQAADIAWHLQTRQGLGKTVIIVDRPSIFLSLVRKQWMKLSREIQRQRASTLDMKLIKELSQQATSMVVMRFVAKSPGSTPKNTEVYLVSPAEPLTLPEDCQNIYICTQLNNQATRNLAQQLPSDAIVVEWCVDT